MNSSGTMAQPQPQPHPQSQATQQRPQFNTPSFNQPSPRDFQAMNGRSNSFNAPSPQISTTYSTPSPRQYSPNLPQAPLPPPPPPKRPRLSPDAPSPFSNPAFSPVGTPQAPSPVNGPSIVTNSMTSNTRPGLMAPPQRPPEKEDRSYNDILSGTGINLEEEQRNMTRNDFYHQANTQSSSTNANSFDSYPANSFGQTPGASFQAGDGILTQSIEITPEQRLEREHERADWEAARHSQHPLWDMFLFGGSLNEKIKKISLDEHMTDPQAGVLVNTQKNAPPPVVRVNGLEGASRVIDKGQSILDTRDKAERLSDILRLISLATKTRLTGFVNASARLSFERREHSKGRVPDEWASMAAVQKTNDQSSGDSAELSHGTTLKRSHSQTNSETLSQSSLIAGPHPSIAVMEKAAQNARNAEEARLAKRAKRAASNKTQDNKESENSESVEQIVANINAEAEKKTTKKERKAADAKLNEQQQHKSANEAARMATSGLIGRGFGGKKSKSYAWMTGGGGAGSTASTPGRAIGSSAGTPAAISTPTSNRPSAVPRGKRFVQWDEERDPGIQARDVLSVLESDGKAARSFVRGCSVIDA